MKGFDKLAINNQLLLGLTFEEMTGVLAHDRAKPRHPLTLHGVPTWNSLGNGLPYLDFVPGNPDWLDCSAADTADLNFMAGDFSMAAWVYVDNWVAANRMVFCRGNGAPAGWYLYIADPGEIAFYTRQAGPGTQTSRSEDILVLSTWALIGVSRHLTSVRTYINGQDRTENAGNHVDPDTAALELHIGIANDEAANPFDGRMAGGPCGPRIWGRCLSADDWACIFHMERGWLGV